MKANYNNKPESETTAALGSLYDLNKVIMMHEVALTQEQIENKKDELHDWIYENVAQKYFMLLCNEQRDYTIFNLNKDNSVDAQLWGGMGAVTDATNDVIECLTNRGELLAADAQPDGTWEFWIRSADECFAYYFFPYGNAVLEY